MSTDTTPGCPGETSGLSPIAYVQQLRIEDAKRRLERDEDAVDEISWRVGYEDPAFFRRLFKRITGISPAAATSRARLRILFGASRTSEVLKNTGP